MVLKMSSGIAEKVAKQYTQSTLSNDLAYSPRCEEKKNIYIYIYFATGHEHKLLSPLG